jgi:transcriptional regulator with XRE-family HTH domain
MAKGVGEKSIAAIGRRLRLTREAMGLSQSEFAQRAGLSKNSYNQYEKGKQRPSLESAISLAETYRITLDWIYLGDNSGLKWELVEAMKKLGTLRQATH